MTTKEAVALLERYSNYDGMGIPNLAGCKEAMRVVVDALKEACPELAESEDERIRKWLLDYAIEMIAGLESDISYDGIKGHDPEAEAELAQWQKARAYLEKQKEPENVSASTMIPSCWEVEQKEQKPINLDLDTLVIELEETIGTSPHSRETIKEFFLKATQKYVNALRKTNKEIGELIEENFYLKEQQPAEWSDYKDKVNVPYCSSEPEWSEEDEEMLNSCISSIEEAKENRYAYKETDGDTSYDHEIDWLKSLRPSWKPSEEQMKALEDAFRKDGSDEYRKTINSLYQQLKKLL